MDPVESESRARAFFDDFVDAFRSFNGAAIAERYLSPYLAFHAPGAAQVFLSAAETGAYFQGVVDEYHAQGARSCRYAGLSVTPMGGHCILAAVTWELVADDQSVVSAWRESYNLCWVDRRFMVYVSNDHAP
jgi:hypothetical protein